jgi:SAM-dependent methyltransferase
MTWHTSHDQWVSWVDEETVAHAAAPLDAFDEALCVRLESAPFPSGNEETVVSGDGAGAHETFDGMSTMVREPPRAHAQGQDEVTSVSAPAPAPAAVPAAAGQLEVALASAPSEAAHPSSPGAGQLEVHLEAPNVDGLYIPALTRSGLTPPSGIEVERGQTVIAPAPPPPPPEAAPRAVSPSEATPPEPMLVGSGDEPQGSQSGDFAVDQSAASSQTAGEIVMLDHEDGEFDPGSSTSGGKIVINTSLREVVVDEEDDEDDEEEADELDASDLVEETEPPPPPQGAPEVPPTPPPAPTPTAPTSDRSEPSLATQAALAELQAETGRGPAMAGPRPWYEEVFEDHYAALTRPSIKETGEADARFFMETAGLAPGAHVLDMGCGQGAHALALAKHGLHVTGVDLSLAQLLRASQAKEATGASVAFLQGDMRDPPVQGPFEGVLCVGSTLGYFSDEENLACLQRMHDMLTPGGKLLIEVFNRDHIISRLPARSWWQGRGCLVLDEAHMDYFANRLLVHRTTVFEDGRQFEHHIDVRAYAVHELVAMCASVGLRVLEISGSRCTRGRFFGATSPDIWLLAERPAQDVR